LLLEVGVQNHYQSLDGHGTLVATKGIHVTQTNFVPGRHILEAVWSFMKCYMMGIVLKFDFEKAYETKFSGRFLKNVLTLKGFCEQWIDWISLSVKMGKVCTNLNGELGRFISNLQRSKTG
jgi:hypothetical protein